jgi:PKD repeat protein
VEPGFEDNTLPDGTGDGRDSWRNNDLGGVIQITGSPVTFGDQGAKMPDDQSRIGYQEIAVEANTVYDLRFWYTMKDNASDPWINVSIVGVTQNGGTFTTTQDALDNTIGSVTVNDTSDPEEYLEQKLTFDSGDNDLVAIYFYNGPVEARLDDFSIEVGTAGAVPPSAGFDITQSAADYLEYTFTNTSTDGETYMWDFGDGNTSTEESPTHVYDTHDIYTVTLEVTNAAGLTATLEKPVDIQAPVTAAFSFVTNQNPDTYQTVEFMDESIGAVELLWEFGDGYQFTGMNPSHTYDADDIYTVTLTATSITGLQDVTTMDVTVALGFIAAISEASFEDDDPSALACGTDQDGRECWRNSDLGGVIQITSGPTVTGSQAAKLPSDGSRIGYQRVVVEEN